MKTLLLLILLCAPAFGDIYSYRTDSATTSITTTFRLVTDTITSAQLKNLRNNQTVLVVNNSSTEIQVECSTGTATVLPSSTSVHAFSVLANNSIAIDGANVSGTCYYRTVTGTLSSGVVVVYAIAG